MAEMSNENQLIEDGNDAQALLNNEIFTRTIDRLVNATFNAFVNSDPKSQEEREKVYHHYRALVDVMHTLTQQVAVRDQIIAQNDNDVAENDDNSGE